jgi:hypothetical protein
MGSEDADRAAIQAAADRLLAGTPLRSTGELTVVQLAAEAGVKRWLLTHKHRDLAERFQAYARTLGGDPPHVQALKARLRALEERNAELRAENVELQALKQHYAVVIIEGVRDARQVGIRWSQRPRHTSAAAAR